MSFVLDGRGPELPSVVHWGADLGPLDTSQLTALCDSTVPGIASNSVDRPHRVGLLPEPALGYAGRASLDGSRADGDWSTRFTTTSITTSLDDDGTQVLTVHARDDDAALELESELRLSVSGVLAHRHTLRNASSTTYELRALPTVLPLPPQAREILDLTGRHLRERAPQRLPFRLGAWVREERRGRTGHDFPLLMAVGEPGFDFRRGEVWAVHVGWSGNTTTFAERLPEGWSGIGGAELLQATEVVVAPKGTYTGPWLYAAYSAQGLDGVSAHFHDLLRSRATHPTSPRPVVLNTWEAVYFDHDLSRLRELASLGATIGVERFVLDDGWFGGRRDDTAGLGDWVVSPDAWPEGLHPLVDHVIALGMDFGLWVEPEMVNLDSALARAHPDWVMSLPGRMPPGARNQQVLDIANPDAYAYLLQHLDALLTDYPIAYLKWDHNRDLVDAVHTSSGHRSPGVHPQTLALYRLLDEIRELHPNVEIESCAGGGGRVDLGILQRTDRVWVSDCNDPLERQRIQRWTSMLLPYELMGAHIGPPRAHTTGRTSDLSFRAGTALFGHLGIEWDITGASADELAQLTAWVTLYKDLRGLLHTGRVVRGDIVDAGPWVHGVVAPDQGEAVYAYVLMETAETAPPPRILLPGLDPGRTYRVTVIDPGPRAATVGDAAPPWWARGEVTLPGSALGGVGLPVPLLGPEQLTLLHVVQDV